MIKRQELIKAIKDMDLRGAIIIPKFWKGLNIIKSSSKSITASENEEITF